MIKNRLLLVTTILLGALLASPVVPAVKADTLGAMTPYDIPGNTKDAGDIIEGADGNLWFIEVLTKNIVVMSKSGVYLNRYALPSTLTYADSISRGHDGNIWFTVTGSSNPTRFGKITPAGVMTTYTLPTGYVGRTTNIVSGSDGYMYTGLSNGSTSNTFIQKYDTNGSLIWAKQTDIMSVEVATDYVNGVVWYAGLNKIGNINPQGDKIEYAMPVSLGTVWAMTMGVDGKVWFINNSGKVGNVSIDGTFSSLYSLGTTSSGDIRSGMDGNMWVTGGQDRAMIRVTLAGAATVFTMPGNWPSPNRIAAGSDGNIWFTDTSQKKLVKFGTGISSTSTDIDGDGLNAGLELTQGTSDLIADTDRDGLNDYVESTSYPSRSTVFCGTSCAYPNPTMKDLYLEIDWMVNGLFSTKPTPGDLVGAATAYGNKGVKVHFDTGSYGGGNQVDYASVVKGEPDDTARDFYDYKLGGDGLTAQFSFDRYHIWRYMLSADELTNSDNEMNLVGLGIPGDDDSLLGYGRLAASYSGTALQNEVGQTIIHEAGHNLCLSSSIAYIGQDSSCIYTYIDSYSAPSTYASAMKYNGTVLDLSSGSNLPSADHDDWSAVLNKGFKDFVASSQGDQEHEALNTESRGFNNKSTKRLFSSTKITE